MHDIASQEGLVFYQLAMSAFRRANITIALRFMSRACARPEAPALWHRNHAEMLDRGGQLEAAEGAARLALRRDPNCASAWETLGTILVQCGALGESRTCYENAIRIEPTFFQALNNLAVTSERLGQFGAAEALYKQALRVAPANAEVQLNLATLLRKLGRYPEGFKIVRQVRQRHPEMTRANSLAAEYTRDLSVALKARAQSVIAGATARWRARNP
jgi:Flp pilus assembly protein TadD